MSARLEVIKNGERVCLAGIDGDGVLGFSATYVRREGEVGEWDMHCGGLADAGGPFSGQRNVAWLPRDIGVGDEVVIRLLPPGEFDEPYRSRAQPEMVIDDPELGRMSYYIDLWSVRIDVDFPPVKSAKLAIWGDEDGPTESKRVLLRELLSRYAGLWPEILAALVRCHPEIDDAAVFEERMKPDIEIYLRKIDDSIELKYQLQDESVSRSYFIKLRKWQVAEIVMSH